jgi:hypothetical protein
MPAILALGGASRGVTSSRPSSAI